MRTWLALAVLGSGLLSATVPLMAHHGFSAEFDADKPLSLKGAVSKVEWTNPHMWIYIDVKDENGRLTTWAIEGSTPNSMIRGGVGRNSLPIGIEIMVEGFQAKSSKAVANGRKVTYPDGRTVTFGSQTDAPGP
jgi:Family of unknown function (DUF6152)